MSHRELRLFSVADVPALAADMRQEHYTPDTLREMALFYQEHPSVTFWVDERPVAAVGVVKVAEDWQVWAYITRAAQGHGLWIVRSLKRLQWMQRLTALCDPTDREAVRLLKLFGMEVST